MGFYSTCNVRTGPCTHSRLNRLTVVKSGRGKWTRLRFLYLTWSGNHARLETRRSTPRATTPRSREGIKERKWNAKRSATRRESENEARKRTVGNAEPRAASVSAVSGASRNALGYAPSRRHAGIVVLELKTRLYSAYKKRTLHMEMQRGEN